VGIFDGIKNALSGNKNKSTADIYDQQERTAQAEGALAGGLGGAASGAAMGAGVAGAPGAVAGGLIGGGIGAIAGIKDAKRTPTEKYEDALQGRLLDAAEANELGYTEAEMDRIAGNQQRATRALAQERQADAARQQLASGDFSGQFGELQRSLAGQEIEGAAAGRAIADQANEAEKNRQRQQLADLSQTRKFRERTLEDERLARQEQIMDQISSFAKTDGDALNDALLGEIMASELGKKNFMDEIEGYDLETISRTV
jgi:hypothetical protein